ncbi:MAG: hypothetical protein ACTSWN_11260, partial [Promethearchaeota archaeon]
KKAKRGMNFSGYEMQNKLQRVKNIDQAMLEALNSIFITRGEPIPYNYLLNLIDLQFLKMGLVPPDTQRSVRKFLENNKNFCWIKGQGWFLQDHVLLDSNRDMQRSRLQNKVKNYLKETIKQLKVLKIKLSTEILVNATFNRFNDILTPDLKLLKEMISKLD